MRKTQNNANDVAKVLICLAHDVGVPLDHLKMQKLLYFAQALSLVRNNKPIFNDVICAWEHGPVVKRVYGIYKENKNKKIPCLETYKYIALPLEDVQVLEDILETFKKYTGVQLRRMTHKHLPWKEVYEAGKNAVISSAIMKEYYMGVFE